MKKYDSKFEKEVHEIMQGCEYHPEERLFYLVPKYYEPDFVYRYRTKTIYIEAKGRFRTSEEARKYFSSNAQTHQCRDHEEEKTVHVTQWKSGQTRTDSSGTPSKQYQQGGEDD